MSDPQREAHERLDGKYEVRVLEPSPPAVDRAPWYADDPTARGSVPQGTRLVGPTSSADITWDEMCRKTANLREWCADRWLGGWRRISSPPPGFHATRDALHVLAEHVLAPARYLSTGRIGLRYTYRGFGTPFFGADEQLRIDRTVIVHQRGPQESRTSISTAAVAAGFVGIPCGAPTEVYEPNTDLEPDSELTVDPVCSAYFGDLIGFGTGILEELRARATDDERCSRVQLWPEHFDLAFELGNEAREERAAYGLSPGDQDHHDPYLYIATWSDAPDDPWWNARSFKGARCDLSRLIEAADQRAVAIDFFEEGRRRLRNRAS